MDIKTTDITMFLNDCFFLCFHDMEDYKWNIRRFIVFSNNKLSLNFKDFIEYLKSKKETFGLIPIDVFYEDFCTKEELRKIEESFDEENITGGYTRLFLEYLFDERFKEEFNNMVKEKLKPALTNSYFSTENHGGLFEFDMVDRYLEEIKNSYKGIGEGYDFSHITEREAVRSTQNKDVMAHKKITEKLDNVYSLYKLYGQEKYSRILISLLNQDSLNEQCIQPRKMLDISTEVIFSDDEIKKTIPEIDKDYRNVKDIDIRIHELDISKLSEELQRFFDDFVPSHLDRIYVTNGSEKHRNETLRDLLIRDFNGIMNEEWALYRKLNENEELYDKLSQRKDLFTYYELTKINKEFDAIANNIPDNKKSLAEKIDYIQKTEPELYKEKRWNIIFEKYKEYYPISTEVVRGEVEKMSSIHSGWMPPNEKELLIELFDELFSGEKQFLSSLEYDLNHFQDFNMSEFFRKLKGSSDHPWARFWTVYRRNSEIDLYQKQAHFTKVMNCIEAKMMENLNA